MTNRICPNCKLRPVQKYHTSKWCKKCAALFRSKPRSTLTRKQIAWVEARIGKMPVTKMAKRLRTSVANVKRAFRGRSLWFKNGKYMQQPALVARVLAHYREHGKAKTVKAFPEVNVKCIVDRPDYYGHPKPMRQVRWTDEQILEAVRMANLVSPLAAARHFNRPRANAGSIRSLWVKRMRAEPRNIHGLPHWIAREIIDTEICPKVRGRAGWIYLYSDMRRHFLPHTPSYIKQAIGTLACFQLKLFDAPNLVALHRKIKIIQRRECCK